MNFCTSYGAYGHYRHFANNYILKKDVFEVTEKNTFGWV